MDWKTLSSSEKSPKLDRWKPCAVVEPEPPPPIPPRIFMRQSSFTKIGNMLNTAMMNGTKRAPTAQPPVAVVFVYATAVCCSNFDESQAHNTTQQITQKVNERVCR
ncbi:unnamed protein product [Ceratitis capitata]|uniref:(Mediterranean fruit fly) hypothetical protein n=1 Tax=Ceratitis capitata TaxID=7213 RepID=A0A811U3R3_CERCA|nr:unnamed protein product [Ceratitis capitata]